MIRFNVQYKNMSGMYINKIGRDNYNALTNVMNSISDTKDFYSNRQEDS